MTAVSVVVPVKNGRSYIGEAISSALSQGDVVREVIVIDDGSTDGTADLVTAIHDPRVRLLRDRAGRQGVSAARNDGVRHASGAWIMFLDADDRLIPGAVAALMERVEPGVAAVYGDYERIDAEGRQAGRRNLVRRGRRKPDGDVLERLLGGNFIVNGGVMLVRKADVDALGGFDETLRYCEDWHLWCRLATRGRFVYRPVHVLDYRVYSSSVMMAREMTMTDYQPAVDAVFADPDIRARVPADRLSSLRRQSEAHLNAYAIGQTIRSGRLGSAAVRLLQVMIRDPKRFPRALMVSGAALVGI